MIALAVVVILLEQAALLRDLPHDHGIACAHGALNKKVAREREHADHAGMPLARVVCRPSRACKGEANRWRILPPAPRECQAAQHRAHAAPIRAWNVPRGRH